jgi:hypothetical protein
MPYEYRNHEFQAVEGWHILDWIITTEPAQYKKTIMPGWLTQIEVEVDQPGGMPMPDNLQAHYPQRRIVPARLDPLSGRLRNATTSPNFYMILAPGEPEPTAEEALEYWDLLNAVERRRNHDR